MIITYERYPVLDRIERKWRRGTSDEPLYTLSKVALRFLGPQEHLGPMMKLLTHWPGWPFNPLAIHFFIDPVSAQVLAARNFSPPLNQTVGGAIVLSDGCLMLYLAFSKRATKYFVKEQDQYIVTALFKGNTFGAYEIATLSRDALWLDPDQRFDDINLLAAGGYIRLAMAAIRQFKSIKQPTPLGAGINKTRHRIFPVSGVD